MSSEFVVLCFLTIGALQGTSFGLKHECPRDEVLEPCSCIDLDGDLMLSCEGLDEKSGAQLRKVVAATAEYDVQSFYLHDSILKTVPDNLFQRSNFVNVLIENVSFLRLDPFAMLSGIKNTVEALQIENCEVGEWRFSKATDFKRFKSFGYSGGHIPPQFPDDFLSYLPDKMIGIEIKNGGIKRISKPGFARFSELEVVNLQGNFLTDFQRNLLPSPANKLTTLDLSNNLLNTLPEDIFEGMPALKTVHLGYNRFSNFEEKALEPVWNQLESLHLGGNLQHCDCHAAWMVKKKPAPKEFTTSFCLSPENVKHRPLTAIPLSELCP